MPCAIFWSPLSIPCREWLSQRISNMWQLLKCANRPCIGHTAHMGTALHVHCVLQWQWYQCKEAPTERVWSKGVQATRNGIRAGDLRDPDAFAAKLRVLAKDGADRFDGFQYDVEADIEAYKVRLYLPCDSHCELCILQKSIIHRPACNSFFDKFFLISNLERIEIWRPGLNCMIHYLSFNLRGSCASAIHRSIPFGWILQRPHVLIGHSSDCQIAHHQAF